MARNAKLTGNYRMDCDSGAFVVDEADPEFEAMYRRVESWDITNEHGRRLDAGETATITRQLLYVKAQTYDVKYPEFKARMFIPPSHDVPTGAESWSFRSYNTFGAAKIIANYANDFPSVDVQVSETLQKIVPLGDSYTYTVQDMRRIGFMQNGGNIDAKKANRARMAMESAMDDIAAVGAPSAGMTGFINNAYVPVIAAPTGNWRSATPLQIIGDLNAGWQTIMNNTLQIEIPDTWVLAPESFNIVTGMPFSTLGNMTVAQWFIQNNPHISNMDQWVKLSLADAAGTGPRNICYRRDPNAVFMEIPQEFEQFAPQLEGMQYTVNCHMRFGGTVFTYPLSAIYMDGC